MKTKHIIFSLISIVVLLLISWIFFIDVYREYKAKESYIDAKWQIENNWAENKSSIKSLFKKINTIQYSGTIELRENNLVYIQIQESIDDNTNSYWALGRENYDSDSSYLYSMEHFKSDTLNHSISEQDYFFHGSINDPDFNIILNLLNKSKDEFIHIKDEIQTIKCHMISWNKNSIKITLIGQPLYGAFRYVDLRSKTDTVDKNLFVLDEEIYWEFYESGLFCAPPVFIPN